MSAHNLAGRSLLCQHTDKNPHSFQHSSRQRGWCYRRVRFCKLSLRHFNPRLEQLPTTLTSTPVWRFLAYTRATVQLFAGLCISPLAATDGEERCHPISQGELGVPDRQLGRLRKGWEYTMRWCTGRIGLNALQHQPNHANIPHESERC